MHDIHLPPPRYGDHSAVNRHLSAGGTVEGIPRENPYREYYLSLHKKNMEKPKVGDYVWFKMPHTGVVTKVYKDNSVRIMLDDIENGTEIERIDEYKVIETNPCGKPHNNGRDTCEECLIIKEGI